MTAAVHGPRVTQELLPCPFCGWANSRSIGIWSDGGFWAECPDCFAQGPVEGTEAEAIAAWNARHREASQAELVEALEKIAAKWHTDRTCSLEAQGYDEVECASIAAEDSLAGIARTALAAHRKAQP